MYYAGGCSYWQRLALYITEHSDIRETRVSSRKYTALHCTVLHCTALHCTALHCTVLHCTALHLELHCVCCTGPHYTAVDKCWHCRESFTDNKYTEDLILLKRRPLSKAVQREASQGSQDIDGWKWDGCRSGKNQPNFRMFRRD